MTKDIPVATAEVSEWQPMKTAPYGSKCLLLTTGGICVVGVTGSTHKGYEAWAPLPKIPAWLKEKTA